MKIKTYLCLTIGTLLLSGTAIAQPDLSGTWSSGSDVDEPAELLFTLIKGANVNADDDAGDAAAGAATLFHHEKKLTHIDRYEVVEYGLATCILYFYASDETFNDKKTKLPERYLFFVNFEELNEDEGLIRLVYNLEEPQQMEILMEDGKLDVNDSAILLTRSK